MQRDLTRFRCCSNMILVIQTVFWAQHPLNPFSRSYGRHFVDVFASYLSKWVALRHTLILMGINNQHFF